MKQRKRRKGRERKNNILIQLVFFFNRDKGFGVATVISMSGE